MKKLLIALAVAMTVALPVTAAIADPPVDGPPGQGECEHGNSGQECKPDPNPDEGKDCEEHGNEGGVNEDHCLTTTAPPTTTTTVPPTTTTTPPSTTTEPPPTTTTTATESPSTSTTTAPPTPTTGPPTTPNCEPSVEFGPWYGDPRINVTLEGPGDYVVRGGIQRFGPGVRHVIRVTLACDQTFRVGRYKVHGGKTVRVYRDGILVASRTAPFLN